MNTKTTHIQLLVDLIATLRDPENGCPWDLEQSHESLISMTFEELSELADAIARNDTQNICEELGDVLFHIVFYAHIAQENNDFSMQSVIDDVVEKMIRRHPHIFEGKIYADEGEQKADWQRIKQEEKAGKSIPYPALDKKQRLEKLPAIAQSIAMQKELAQLGFDWTKAADVFDKIDEEIDELKAELPDNQSEISNMTFSEKRMTEEYGDLLFAVLNLGRKLRIEPDMALRKANHKFYSRSEKMIALAQGVNNFAKLSLDQKEDLWNKVKKNT